MVSETVPSAAPAAVARAIVDQLKRAGVTIAAGLNDDWVTPVISGLDDDPDVTFVRVSREPEALAICSGAFLGGRRAVGVMGSAGLMACASEIVSFSQKYRVPAFLLVSHRGGLYDLQVYTQCDRKIPQIAEAMDLPSLTLRRFEEIALIPNAFEECLILKTAYVVWVTKELLTGAVPQ